MAITEEFVPVIEGVSALLPKYKSRLENVESEVLNARRNSQGRSIKQIIGHMIDSASNNTHRIVHLQYRRSPVDFPNYATNGNNDRWIAIQKFQDEDWKILLGLWEYSHLHLVHVIRNIGEENLERAWINAPGHSVTLHDMVVDFLRHFNLHLDEIDELINR